MIEEKERLEEINDYLCMAYEALDELNLSEDEAEVWLSNYWSSLEKED